MNHVVVEHTYNAESDTYHIVIVERGETSFEVPTLDEEGNPVLDEEGNVVTETTTEVVDQNPFDIVWSGDDKKWFKNGKRRPDAEVAAEQRKIAKDVLKPRTSVPDAMPEVKTMPGTGEAL